MVTEVRSVLAPKDRELILGRITFIANTGRKDGRLYRRRNLPHTLALRGLTAAFIAESRLQGSKNLDLFVKRIGRERLTMAGNHTSDTDHPALENVFLQNGHGTIADLLVFPAGLKMWDRPQTAWAMDGMNNFPIAASGYYDEINEWARYDLIEDERELLVEYKSNLDRLNKTSLNAVLPDWRRGKAIVVVYPESTRSRTGYVERGREETAAYFRRGLILPFMIEGPADAFPPESNPNWGLIFQRYKGEKGWVVTVSAGQPIVGEVLSSRKTQDWLRERDANPVDFVMSRIVALKPEKADPNDRPLYQSLTEDIPAGLLLAA